MTEQIQKFLDAVIPQEPGKYAVLAVAVGGVFRQITSPATEVRQTIKILSQPNTPEKGISGVFFSPVLYNSPTGAGGKGHPRGAGGEYVDAMRAFWLDIDVGGANSYPTKADAVKGVAAFLGASGLPSPQVVLDSGHGIHVYWLLREPLLPDRWKPMAARLKELTKEHGLLCDHSVTSDVARVMRLPGTVNAKREPHTHCRILKGDYSVLYADELFDALKDVDAEALAHAKALLGDADDAGLVDDAEPSYGPTRMADIVQQCAYLGAVAQDAGAGCSEPMWKDVLSICAVCEDGEEWAHKLSSGHEDYNQSKVDAKLAERVKWGKPALCSSLQETNSYGCDMCKGCTLGVKSPAVLGHVVAAPPAPPEDKLCLPNGFWYDKEEGVIKYRYRRSKEEGGGTVVKQALRVNGLVEAVLVTFSSDTPLVAEKRSPELSLTQLRPGGGSTREQRIALTSLASTTSIAQTLAKAYITPCAGFNQTKQTEFVMNWIAKLRENRRETESPLAFGWDMEDPEVVRFNTGDRTFLPGSNGGRRVVAPDPELGKKYSAVGSLETWKSHAAMIMSTAQPELHVMVATAFAAPLMMLTGHSGIAFNFFSSQSGVGKSTALDLAQSVWGRPKITHSLNDTAAAVGHTLATLNNLPCYWDEVRMADSLQAYVTQMFALTQGKEKARLTKNVTAAQVRTWQTVLVSATNSSLLPVINAECRESEAGNMRIFELEVPMPDAEKRLESTLSHDMTVISRNYGLAGKEYAQYLVDRFIELQHRVKLTEVRLTREWRAASSNRLWVAGCAVVLEGAKSAKELGLIDFDLELMEQTLYKAFKNMTSASAEYDAERTMAAIIRDYIQENIDLTVVTDRIATPGRPSTVIQLHAMCGSRHPRVQIGRDDMTALISLPHLRNYLERRFDYAHADRLVKDLRRTRDRADGLRVKERKGIVANGVAPTSCHNEGVQIRHAMIMVSDVPGVGDRMGLVDAMTMLIQDAGALPRHGGLKVVAGDDDE